MLTAWGKKIASVAVQGGILPYPFVQNTSNAYIEAKSVAGNTYYISSKPYSSVSYAALTVAVGERTNAGVMFGSGNKAESENDYTLENQIVGFTAQTPSIETYFDNANNRYVAQLNYAISNNTGSEITIREVGLLGHYSIANQRGTTPSGGTQYRYTFMIDRTLLASPVTIADGDAGLVRYEFAYLENAI